MIFARDILKGRKYLVTGSTGGAGSATASLIADCGGIVTCMGRDPERTEKVKRSLSGGGHDVGIMDFSTGVGKFPIAKYDGVFHAAGEELILASGMLRAEAIVSVFDPSVRAAFELTALIGKRDSLLKDGGTFIVDKSKVSQRCAARLA